MIRWFFGLIISVVAIIIGFGIYLQPDDLTVCAESPSNITNCQAVDAVVYAAYIVQLDASKHAVAATVVQQRPEELGIVILKAFNPRLHGGEPLPIKHLRLLG